MAPKSNHARGNRFTAKKPDSDVSRKVLRKRVSGRMLHAIKQAPQFVQDKWAEIEKLKGKRGSGIFRHKQEFLMRWVSDPSWALPIDITLSKYCLYKALPV